MDMVRTSVCLTEKMHKIVAWVTYHHDITLSQLVRAAFREIEISNITPENASANGSGRFRTMIIFEKQFLLYIDELSIHLNMNRSAIIRAALHVRLQQYNPKSPTYKFLLPEYLNHLIAEEN